MRKKILRCISLCLQAISSLLVKWHVLKPIVVVHIDGGICSQMMAYLRGQYYAQGGMDVFYDLKWFETSGMDNYGKFERPFELLEAFPKLELNQKSNFKTAFYRHFMRYGYTNNMLPDRNTLTRSVYLSLYPDFASNEDFNKLFSHIYAPKSYAQFGKHIDVPKNYNSCGIHVRKGDMTNWMAIRDDYFIEAVKYVQRKYPKVKFFFFSDEPNWVIDHIVPQLPSVTYETITGNKGHEDLLLCSQCNVIVASQGTMGRFAALLNPQSELIVPSENEEVGFPVLRYRKGTVIEQFN